MSFANTDFTAPAKAQIDAAIRAVTIASESFTRLVELNTRTTRAALDEFTTAVQSVAAVKDPAELRTLASGAFKPDFEKSQAYARSVYEEVANTHAELSALVESQIGEFHKQMGGTLDGLLKSAPAGSEPFVSAFKTAMSSANQAYETSVQTLKEVSGSLTTVAAPRASSKRKAA